MLSKVDKNNSESGLHLTKKDLHKNPVYEFEKWFKRADANEIQANAMSLATVSESLQPTIRTVLLKYFDEDGFTFFTNYKSRKSRDIAENSKVAVKFYWPNLEQQLIILGKAEKISRLKSMQYFMSRPDGSKIGAWCSDQTEFLNSREMLQSRFKAFQKQFKNKEIPKPQHWGGYRIIPHRFEFWQGGEFRLHDRFRYTLTKNNDWELQRVVP